MANQTRTPVASLKGPRGFTGPRGLPGAADVPTDPAVAEILAAEDSQSREEMRLATAADLASVDANAARLGLLRAVRSDSACRKRFSGTPS